MGGAYMAEIIATRDTDPQQHALWKQKAEEVNYATHFSQVVSLEETLGVLELAYPIARMTCACRRAGRALPDDQNFACLGIGPGMYKWERWPESYRGGVDFLTPQEAKEWVIYLDKVGLVHTIETFGTPYIGGMCQCDYPDCGMIRMRLDYGVKVLVKGHGVATVDYSKCNGCAACIRRCQFAALRMEVSANKAHVDQFRCFGCGLCATGCPKHAINLIERATLPALANDW
jgi:Pyruvate/2-oxoacid:ferredoxin oxidoreductase delta subunit